MQTMNISLPDPLKDFVDHQIAEGQKNAWKCYYSKGWPAKRAS
jgi:hypothetical protein